MVSRTLGVSYTMHQAGRVDVYYVNGTTGRVKSTLIATYRGDSKYFHTPGNYFVSFCKVVPGK